LSDLGISRAGARLRWAGLFGLIAVLSLCLMPGVADAAKKKKKDTVKVMSYNLYLGSDLGPAVAAAREGEGVAGPRGQARRLMAFDHFADEVGNILDDVNGNKFPARARGIAKVIKKQKVDLVGLQEAALFRLEIPTDGGGPPRGTSALVPLIDYIDTLLDELNKNARSKKACGKAAKERKAQGKKPKPCYRGYRLVRAQQEADIEQPGDFDRDPGPNGIPGEGPTFSGIFGAPPCGSTSLPQETNPGGDDPGVHIGDPGPPNTTVTDPATGEVVPFDWNGDSNSNSRHTGDPDSPPCEADTLPPHVFGVTAPPYEYASDCPDNNPLDGVSGGSDDDTDTTSSCLFHGIDGDARLTMRDVILARKGAGVKTSNVTGGNYSPGSTFSVPIFGGAATVAFTRGWVQADVSVRGKKFRLVNTHLEAESNGSIREDQASELVAPGGPATAAKTVLIGDLNSDPAREPTNLPDGDGGSKIAIDRLFAAGFRSISGPGLTGGHGELLSDLSNLLTDGRIDHILTNSPSIRLGSSVVVDPIVPCGPQFKRCLWASDHGGVLSRLRVPGGKKK
jgi:hypothetical protein